MNRGEDVRLKKHSKQSFLRLLSDPSYVPSLGYSRISKLKNRTLYLPDSSTLDTNLH